MGFRKLTGLSEKTVWNESFSESDSRHQMLTAFGVTVLAVRVAGPALRATGDRASRCKLRAKPLIVRLHSVS